jgi:hypothetical protein
MEISAAVHRLYDAVMASNHSKTELDESLVSDAVKAVVVAVQAKVEAQNAAKDQSQLEHETLLRVCDPLALAHSLGDKCP